MGLDRGVRAKGGVLGRKRELAIGPDRDDATTVQTVTPLEHSLGIRVIAEGMTGEFQRLSSRCCYGKIGRCRCRLIV